MATRGANGRADGRRGRVVNDGRDRRAASRSASHARRRAHVRDGAREKSGLPLAARMVIVLAVVVALGAGGFFAWRCLTGGMQAREQINLAIKAVQEADTVIVEVNDAVSSPIGDTASFTDEQLSSGSRSATEALMRASDNISRARGLNEFLDDDQRAVLSALDDSISARKSMLGAGQVIVSVDASVGKARNLLEQSLAKAASADAKAREAATAANEYAKHLAGQESQQADANVPVTIDNEAISLLNEANDLLGQAKSAFGDADYSAYEAYLSKKVEAAQLMLEADSAILSGDFERAGECVAKYNETDAAASELAAALPATTNDVFLDPYTRLTSAERESYLAAQQKATEADALVRKYLGVGVSVATTDPAAASSTPGSTAATTVGAAGDSAAGDVSASDSPTIQAPSAS